MKVNGHGQAAVLAPTQVERLFREGLHRALFGVLFYTGCRVSEALALRVEDIAGGVVTLRKATTKGKKATRTIPLHPKLARLLSEYDPQPGPLFPGRLQGTLTRVAAHKILRRACKRVGLEGVSTHSFRRTALTRMSDAAVPLRVIQKVSGHASLATLQRYLEVSQQQVEAAISVL